MDAGTLVAITLGALCGAAIFVGAAIGVYTSWAGRRRSQALGSSVDPAVCGIVV